MGKSKLTRNIKTAGFAAIIAAALASSASGSTISQTLFYGPPGTLWTHRFSFAPFVGPTLTTQFTGLQLAISFTQTTKDGLLDCLSGSVGSGQAAATCNGTYFQRGAFSLLSPNLLNAPIPDLIVQQTGTIDHVLEDDIFVAPPILNAATVAGITVTDHYSYANSVAAFGGTLNPAQFTGTAPVDFIFQVSASNGTNLPAGGNAALTFDSIDYSIKAALIYNYTDVPEPASLVLFCTAGLALAVARRPGRTAWV